MEVSARTRSTRTVEDLAAGIAKCLNEALTVRMPDERAAVDMMRQESLPALSAMCALGRVDIHLNQTIAPTKHSIPANEVAVFS